MRHCRLGVEADQAAGIGARLERAQILGPLAGWSRSWADLEQRLLKMGRKPEAEGEASV